MKHLGVVREIDQLGRVVLPKEIRDVFGWPSGTKIQFLATDDSLIIKSFTYQCAACKKSEDNLIKLGDVQICKPCLESVE